VESNFAFVPEEVLNGGFSHQAVIGVTVVFEAALHFLGIVVGTLNFGLREVTNTVD
jgi:hypothetical protein